MSPSRNRPKERTSRPPSNRRALVREVIDLWTSKVPEQTREPLLWGTLRSLVEDLSSSIPEKMLGSIMSAVGSRDFKQLLELGAGLTRPQLHDGSSGYFATSSVLNLLKKYQFQGGVSGYDPLKTGEERFYMAEKLCRITNRRFRHYRKYDFASRPLVQGLRLHEVFHLARRKIAMWLGPVDMELIYGNARFGPGGVVGLKRPNTTPFFKLRQDVKSVTQGAYWHAIRYITQSDGWIRAILLENGLVDWEHDMSCVPFETKVRAVDKHVEIANQNEVTFVPKDVKTHRSIAIEASLNVMLQLGVGEFMKSRLRNVGCDLKDQTRNQHLALLGSYNSDRDDPVTIDLSMASDCNSIELVRELLPPEWFELLDSLRAREGRYKDRAFVWEKFSSMGNGFTFELESMIFYALAQSVGDIIGTTARFADTYGQRYKYAYTSVFGDDIIVPSEVAAHLIRVLRFCGFRANDDKTYLEGPFRESCGKDYWNGVDVRAFYFKRPIQRVADLLHLHNGLKQLLNKVGIENSKALSFVRSHLPKNLDYHLRSSVETVGDTHLWVEPDECHRSSLVTWSTDYQTWQTPQVVEKAVSFRGSLIWRYCQFLYTTTRAQMPERGKSGLPIPKGEGDPGDITKSGTVEAHLTWVPI